MVEGVGGAGCSHRGIGQQVTGVVGEGVGVVGRCTCLADLCLEIAASIIGMCDDFSGFGRGQQLVHGVVDIGGRYAIVDFGDTVSSIIVGKRRDNSAQCFRHQAMSIIIVPCSCDVCPTIQRNNRLFRIAAAVILINLFAQNIP